jgi:hypothetical protein
VAYGFGIAEREDLAVTVTLDPPDPGRNDLELDPAPSRRELPSVEMLRIAAVASIAAGIINTGAIAAHSDHRAAVWTFLVVAVVQVGWGAYALARPLRWVAYVGAALGLAAFAGWVVATSNGSGIWFISGLNAKQPMHFADGLCAALAVITLIAASASLTVRPRYVPRGLAFGVAVVMLIVAASGTVSAVNLSQNQGTAVSTSAGPYASAPAVTTHAFNPLLHIDLSGVPGVTPQEQARAENLLAATVDLLPQWSDPAYDEAHGFSSIGDGVTGTEHYINETFINDNVMLDPDRPESLVFDTTVRPKKLVAAMYMGTPGMTLQTVPDIGGALTQWHIHDNLCFSAAGKVAGLTRPDGSCSAPLTKGPLIPMIHVWIVPHKCGPFAALEGIGGGQILPGETVACDQLHAG